MSVIREQAVFAWALTGINGSLAEHAKGKPTGSSAPSDGFSVWANDAAQNTGSTESHHDNGRSHGDERRAASQMFGDPGLGRGGGNGFMRWEFIRTIARDKDVPTLYGHYLPRVALRWGILAWMRRESSHINPREWAFPCNARRKIRKFCKAHMSAKLPKPTEEINDTAHERFLGRMIWLSIYLFSFHGSKWEQTDNGVITLPHAFRRKSLAF
jgi:hypothetical protein